MARSANLHSISKHRLLDAAAELFATRSYASVRLRDIAQAAGLPHTLLYHYLPGGKEALYFTVMQRSFDGHRAGLEQAAEHAPPTLRDQLYAIADWFVSQPPIDSTRMLQTDALNLSQAAALRLAAHGDRALHDPIVAVLAVAEPDLLPMPLEQAAMALVSLVQSVHRLPSSVAHKAALAHQMVDMLLDGWRPRPE